MGAQKLSCIPTRDGVWFTRLCLADTGRMERTRCRFSCGNELILWWSPVIVVLICDLVDNHLYIHPTLLGGLCLHLLPDANIHSPLSVFIHCLDHWVYSLACISEKTSVVIFRHIHLFGTLAFSYMPFSWWCHCCVVCCSMGRCKLEIITSK